MIGLSFRVPSPGRAKCSAGSTAIWSLSTSCSCPGWLLSTIPYANLSRRWVWQWHQCKLFDIIYDDIIIHTHHPFTSSNSSFIFCSILSPSCDVIRHFSHGVHWTLFFAWSATFNLKLLPAPSASSSIPFSTCSNRSAVTGIETRFELSKFLFFIAFYAPSRRPRSAFC